MRVLVLFLSLACGPVAAQTFDSYRSFRDSLAAVVSLVDPGARDAALGSLWNTLKAEGQVPFRHQDSVAFLHFEQEVAVAIAGDFNRWTTNAWPAARMGDTWMWIREATFPVDARLDYKFVIDNRTWILDPANPHWQWGGFGPNSELRMPGYVPSPFVVPVDGRASGSYTQNQAIASSALGYSVNYRVYTPPGYESGLSNLPVVYVTDGHEYADDRVGAMRVVLDNLIAESLIVPTIAVFIDPRVAGDNLRGWQYIQNPDFASFVADELVPEIDAAYRTWPHRDGRAILGTSLGGLNSAYFGVVRHETFGNVAIQSPSFSGRQWIFDLYRNEPVRDTRIHMTWGTINDVGSAPAEMSWLMESKGYELETVIVNEGHSWGAWRALIDDALMYFFPQGTTLDFRDDEVPGRTRIGTMYPNPSRGEVAITYFVAETGLVSLDVFDLLGRSVFSRSKSLAGPGEHRERWATGHLAPGVHLVSLRLNGRAAEVRLLTVL